MFAYSLLWKYIQENFYDLTILIMNYGLPNILAWRDRQAVNIINLLRRIVQ